jgi:hypothetical protein
LSGTAFTTDRPPDGKHQSGLHSLLADRLRGAHLLADLETAEPPTDTLLREAAGGNEAVVASGKRCRNDTVRSVFVRFHLPSSMRA